ncbi:hypothetical protein DVA86_18760 [Streptomyces armeniacus]|uniref:Uncharacterized protein n=1 Tax=Streptomyces armeniacus TaxID=83291 RepID=A0A345XRW6_9ACTN|nr:hypothetical protein [Streptomyces armeniacus]AXK34382.1 hypothetical protein DVA86_18760 [Streptomyces armeniacus]
MDEPTQYEPGSEHETRLLGQEAARALNQALTTAGLVLPSVEGGRSVRGTAIVRLGNAPAAEVVKLAHWIMERA